MFRNDVCTLDKLSSTDVACYWAKSDGKKKVEQDYKPVPITDLCHARDYSIVSNVTAERRIAFINKLIASFPNSGLAKHKRRELLPLEASVPDSSL